MSIHDKEWRYVPAKSMAPGYLKRKFAKVRSEQKAVAEAKAVKVTPIRKGAAK